MKGQLLFADTIEDALGMKDSSSAYLAGGTEVLRLGGSVKADRLIDLKKTEGLKGISRSGNMVKIGAMTTFQQALEDPFTPAYLKEALLYMGSMPKRNMATVGGNLALLRDDSYLAAVLIAAHAEAGLAYPGGKQEKICIGKYLREKESLADALITEITVRDDIRVVSRRWANTVESHSFLACALGIVDGHHRVGITVKNSGVFFPKEESKKLDEGQSPEEIMEWAESWEGLDIPDDRFGSTAYKRYLLGVTLEELAGALGRQMPEEDGKEAGRS